jgi:hypothetical protein
MILLPHKPKSNRRRTNPKSCGESKEDRLSDLPDSIIHHILSFLKTKQVFQTCVLSTRWNHLTKNLPTLKLFSEDFTSSDSFTKSMSQILSVRDDSTPLPTLHFHDDHGFVESEVFESIVEYAVSHRVQLLGITISRDDIQRFPSCLFSSQTLTSLHLTVGLFRKILFPNSLNCPTLTTLTLRSFYFGAAGDDGCAEPFSSFNRLHTLVIHNFKLLPDAQILCISSTTLVNLTISGHGFHTNHSYVCKLSSPTLCNFSFTGILYQKPFCTHLCSVKHIYIDGDNICHSIQHYSAILLSWLLELSNVKSLTISSNTLQVLHFLLLIISKFCEKCMTINPNSPSSFIAFHRFSPLFLIYSRLNSLPCVTWSHCKSK